MSTDSARTTWTPAETVLAVGKDAAGAVLPQKADPVGFGAEHPPATASIACDIGGKVWLESTRFRGYRTLWDEEFTTPPTHLPYQPELRR